MLLYLICLFCVKYDMLVIMDSEQIRKWGDKIVIYLNWLQKQENIRISRYGLTSSS
jgi:hypothetical protein